MKLSLSWKSKEVSLFLVITMTIFFGVLGEASLAGKASKFEKTEFQKIIKKSFKALTTDHGTRGLYC